MKRTFKNFILATIVVAILGTGMLGLLEAMIGAPMLFLICVTITFVVSTAIIVKQILKN